MGAGHNQSISKDKLAGTIVQFQGFQTEVAFEVIGTVKALAYRQWLQPKSTLNQRWPTISRY